MTSSTGALFPGRIASDLADDVAVLLADLLSEARSLLASDTATVLLIDQTGHHLDTVASVGIEVNVHQRSRVQMGAGFAGRVAEGRHAISVDDVRPDTVTNPLLRRSGLHSLLGVPLMDDDELIGVLHVGSFSRRVFDAADQAALVGVSRRVAHALAARLHASQRSAAVAMQHSLLPSGLPAVAGIELAARYLPAVGSLGGDWYDVFSLPAEHGDLLGVVIGDVIGHGYRAAIRMGRLRSALRAFAVESTDPADALSRLDRMSRHFEPDTMATVLYAVVDAASGQVRLSSAGHLPPAIVHPSGPAELVVLQPAPPIGVPDESRRTTELTLPEGASLLFFTDGLVERRPPSSLREAMADLTRMVSGDDAEEIGRSAIDAMFSDRQPDDDVALVVLRRLPGHPQAPGHSG